MSDGECVCHRHGHLARLSLDSFFIFTKSNYSQTLVDLIFPLYLIYPRDTYLILPITSRSLSHFLYLSFKALVISMTSYRNRGQEVSTRRSEGGLPRPTRRRSESQLTCRATLGPSSLMGTSQPGTGIGTATSFSSISNSSPELLPASTTVSSSSTTIGFAAMCSNPRIISCMASILSSMALILFC